jgi:hypothetical protein
LGRSQFKASLSKKLARLYISSKLGVVVPIIPICVESHRQEACSADRPRAKLQHLT